MKQYKIKSENINLDSVDDTALSPDDPIQELKIISYLAGLNSKNRLQEYRLQNQEITGSNISLTGNEKAQIQKERNIQPGTSEWFKLWFTRPYLTGSKPI